MRALVRRQKASLDPKAHDHETLLSADFCPFPESEYDGLTCSIAPSNPGLYLLEVERKHGPRSACEESVPGLIEVGRRC